MGRFDHLIYTMPPEYHSWEGYASPRAGYPGHEVHPNSHLNMGFSVATKAEYMEVPHMHHAVDEYLIFTGADLVNFFESFDAEVEVWLGDDPLKMEKVTITKPTIIRVPPNTWHCPINFKRVGKPVCFIPLYLDGRWSKITRELDEKGREYFKYDGEGVRHCVYNPDEFCTYCGKCFSERAKEAEDAGTLEDFLKPYYEMAERCRTGKFDALVHTFEPDYHQWGDCFANPRAGLAGTQEMEGARVYFGYDIMLKECVMDSPHIHHAVEEYLIFTGADLMDPFASFDAEITIMMGDNPDDMEEYTITEPCVIRIPPNFWHCPIRFKRIGKPVNFIPMYPDGCWSKITREFKEDGTPRFIYEGVGLAHCRLKPEKICSYCGKCFSMMTEAQKKNET